MSIRDRLSGNEAVAYAMRQINPDVFAAFPITPSTEIPQYFAQYVADGKVDTEYVTVESEHSSMSTCIGASAAGVRAVTATSSCGLAYMYELLYVAASARLPITLACVNRALTGPININNDHSDSMGTRDAGWIQLYAENMLRALDEGDKAVVCNATSCLEVSSFLYPYTAWEDSYIHSAFENAAATCGGVEAAYNVLKRKGKIDGTYKFLAIGGDGGTYDIGFQSLSGAMERGHDMVYFCYDNEAYMNTGIQRSSSTPRFASATTTPTGTVSVGKKQNKKDLTEIMVAHNIPYVAQTTFLGNFKDFHEKAHRAIYTEGPAFVNVMSPCPRGWQYSTELLPEICKMAVETCVWPLYEVIEGKWHLNYMPKNKLPVTEFMKLQGRFKHCFKPGNEWTLEAAQQYVDEQWEKLLEKCDNA